MNDFLGVHIKHLTGRNGCNGEKYKIRLTQSGLINKP